MITRLSAALASLMLLATPLAAHHTDGVDNDGDGFIDEPDEQDEGSLSSDNMETECLTSARPEICIAYHQFACNTQGQQGACQLAQIGQSCYGGDPAQCQYYVGLITANRDCYMGDQNGCAYLQSQGY